MAKKIASELLVERLIDWGVDTIFGLPGDGINGHVDGRVPHRGLAPPSNQGDHLQQQLARHTARSLHVHPACAVPNLRHVEYFHDHALADRLLFDGVLDPSGCVLRPDLGRPGAGLELKRADAGKFRKE